ncbi:hypothetical protein BDV06DRAFT_227957 [Aspergillus oleicola]
MYNYKLLLPAVLAFSTVAIAQDSAPEADVNVTSLPGTSTSTNVGSVTTLPGTSTEEWTATLPVETLPGTSSDDWTATLPVETETPTGTFTILPIDWPTDTETPVPTVTHPVGSGTPPWWATPGPSQSPTGSSMTSLPTGSSSPSTSVPTGSPTVSDGPEFTGGVGAMNAPAFWAVAGVALGIVVA